MSGKLKAVLVGCGGISNAWMDVVKDLSGVEMAGYVDLDHAAGQKLAEKFGPAGVYVYTDLKEAFARMKPDVVLNCTVPEAHAEVSIVALKSGSHVLVEKPLADTIENASAMIAAAARSGKILAVTQNRRYQKSIRRLKRFLESGAIGRVGTVHCDFMIGAHFGGFRDHMRHVLLLDMAIHTIDAGRFLVGQDPVAVSCIEWNPPGSWFDHDASAAATFEMAGGCVYTYRGSWCAEGLNTSWECDWRIIGETGTVKWDGGDGFSAQVVSERGGFFSKWKNVEIPPAHADDKDGGHAGVIGEFFECVRSGRVPETVCTDNVKSLAMVLGAIASSEEKRRVDIRWG